MNIDLMNGEAFDIELRPGLPIFGPDILLDTKMLDSLRSRHLQLLTPGVATFNPRGSGY